MQLDNVILKHPVQGYCKGNLSLKEDRIEKVVIIDEDACKDLKREKIFVMGNIHFETVNLSQNILYCRS